MLTPNPSWPEAPLRSRVGVHLSKLSVSMNSVEETQVERTFLLPPVMVTLTKRRVYEILFLARPLGVFFFS